MVKLIHKFSLIILVLLGAHNLVAETILLQGGKVHTLGALGSIDRADVLIKEGKIVEVGTDLEVPEGAVVFDTRGKHISPGIMNASTALGLVEIGAVKSSVDFRNTEAKYSTSVKVADVINNHSSLWAHNRSNGLTHAVVKPSHSKSLFAGQGALIQLTDNQDHLVLRDNAFYLTYGDAAAERAGGSRAVALVQIREVFSELSAYLNDSKPESFIPKGILKLRELKALAPVITESKPLVVTAHRANDILAMLKLAQDYSLTMIISGAEEAWRVREEIAKAKVALLLNPYNNLPDSMETIGNRIDQMTLLHEAGVPMMISNNASHNAYVIRQIAGNAVAYGLPWEVALSAISKTPAQWFGNGQKFGSLESGMRADLVVWDGDPLETTTSAEHIFIAGQQMPVVSRQTKLRDRYLKKDGRNPAYHH